MTNDFEESGATRWSTPCVTFGDFSFHFANAFLYRDGATVLLQQRASKVLCYFLQRPLKVVSREELIERVWESAHISDASVTEAIKVLRTVLGDDPTDPTYIQTIQGRGYRFIAPIKEDPFDPVVPAKSGRRPGARTGRIWDPRLWMATTAFLALVVLLLLLLLLTGP